MNNGSASLRLPVIPERITVHLGPPNSPTANVTLPFADYIKNVASSEIYPTWPESAIRANMLAQISFALNRVYTEYYRSRGYDFDITNSTAIDQSFVAGRDIFDNISQLADQLFNNYLRRRGSIEPLFAAYCDGVEVQCGGLSQWGSVALAEEGYTTYDILRYYYGDDIDIIANAPVEGVRESYPGIPLRLGSVNDPVRTLQLRLNRIGKNYPSIPRLAQVDGVFGERTEEAVRAFQQIFNLTPDGVVGPGTWYSIARIYAGVKRLADLDSEGIALSDVTPLFQQSAGRGDTGTAIRELQYYLSFVAAFNNRVQPTVIDGIFGAGTEASLKDFQQVYNLPVTGRADLDTWRALYNAYRGYLVSLPPNYFGVDVDPYPGVPLVRGSSGGNVVTIQTWLSRIREAYPSIPPLTIDGDYGPATEQAVRRYQQLFGLPPNGTVTSAVWNSLAETYVALEEGEFGAVTRYSEI